jgi:cobalamin synthase
MNYQVDGNDEQEIVQNRRLLNLNLILLVLLDLIAIGLLFMVQSQLIWYLLLAALFFIPGLISGLAQSTEKTLKMKYHRLFFRQKSSLKLIIWLVIAPIVSLIMKFDFQNQIGFLSIAICIFFVILILENKGN